MLKAAVVGASGYVGGELLRLLLGHPRIEAAQATSRRYRGRAVGFVHPNLRRASSLKFRSPEDLQPADLIFLCLPHGEAAAHMDDYARLAARIVDCSADFRLRDAAAHRRWYGEETLAELWRSRFVYGLPEIERRRLAEASYISGVGCNATATILALLPLARAELIEQAAVEVKVGSSEAGAKASGSSHHPERSGAVRSFAPVGHRHQAEICQALRLDPERLFFSVTAVERVRGAVATAQVSLRRPLSPQAVRRLFRQTYGGEPFVRLVAERSGLHRLPEPQVVAGTNFCDVGWAQDGRSDHRLVSIAALDNLVKGAAGSAVQAINLSLGLDETTGLGFPGLHPY